MNIVLAGASVGLRGYGSGPGNRPLDEQKSQAVLAGKVMAGFLEEVVLKKSLTAGGGKKRAQQVAQRAAMSSSLLEVPEICRFWAYRLLSHTHFTSEKPDSQSKDSKA